MRGELDEPGMKADAIGRSEPDVFIEEAETGRSDGVGLGETGQHRDVHEPLLKRHQQRQPRHPHSAEPVQQRVQVRHHDEHLIVAFDALISD